VAIPPTNSKAYRCLIDLFLNFSDKRLEKYSEKSALAKRKIKWEAGRQVVTKKNPHVLTGGLQKI
jgi:hypothetical protein